MDAHPGQDFPQGVAPEMVAPQAEDPAADLTGFGLREPEEEPGKQIVPGAACEPETVFINEREGCVSMDERVSFDDPVLESRIREAILEITGEEASGEIRVRDLQVITFLRASRKDDPEGRRIINLDGLRYCTNLQVLFLMDNWIMDIGEIVNLRGLRNLDLSFNRIRRLPSMLHLRHLQFLHLDRNERILDYTPLLEIASLKALGLSRNGIRDINWLRHFRELKYLNLNGNRITDIMPLSSSSSSMEGLYLSGNSIMELSPLTNMSNLKVLSLGINPLIVDISHLANLTSLTALRLNENGQMTDLSPLASLPSLKSLDLSRNPQITDYGRLIRSDSQFVHSLENLDISRNGIVCDVDSCIINSFVGGMSALKFLKMDYNKIEKLNYLLRLNNMETLLLGHNRITNLQSLMNLHSLCKLDISYNEIGDLRPLVNLNDLDAFEGQGCWIDLRGTPALRAVDVPDEGMILPETRAQPPSHTAIRELEMRDVRLIAQ